MGECLTGSQKVTGSSPVISTIYILKFKVCDFGVIYNNKTVIIMTPINLEKNNNAVI